MIQSGWELHGWLILHPVPSTIRFRMTADCVDDGARRVALLDWLADDDAAAGLDGVAADDLIRGPVGALDQDVGLDARDDVGRRVLVEDRHGVDAVEREEDFRALALRVDRPRRALVAADRRVGVQPDDQQIAVRARAACR